MTLFSDATFQLAYIGPGLGLGAIALFLTVLLSVFLAIVGVAWYPIKRMIRAMRGSKDSHSKPTDHEPDF